jgi:ABC-type microcin C transport system permease subunit YejE
LKVLSVRFVGCLVKVELGVVLGNYDFGTHMIAEYQIATWDGMSYFFGVEFNELSVDLLILAGGFCCIP